MTSQVEVGTRCGTSPRPRVSPSSWNLWNPRGQMGWNFVTARVRRWWARWMEYQRFFNKNWGWMMEFTSYFDVKMSIHRKSTVTLWRGTVSIVMLATRYVGWMTISHQCGSSCQVWDNNPVWDLEFGYHLFWMTDLLAEISTLFTHWYMSKSKLH